MAEALGATWPSFAAAFSELFGFADEVLAAPIALLTYRASNVPFYERRGYACVCHAHEPRSGVPFWGFRRSPAPGTLERLAPDA